MSINVSDSCFLFKCNLNKRPLYKLISGIDNGSCNVCWQLIKIERTLSYVYAICCNITQFTTADHALIRSTTGVRFGVKLRYSIRAVVGSASE